jgi:hypothetical protein
MHNDNTQYQAPRVYYPGSSYIDYTAHNTREKLYETLASLRGLRASMFVDLVGRGSDLSPEDCPGLDWINALIDTLTPMTQNFSNNVRRTSDVVERTNAAKAELATRVAACREAVPATFSNASRPSDDGEGEVTL